MHTPISRNNPLPFRRALAAALALLFVLAAAACTEDALLSPDGVRPLGTGAPLVSVTPDTAFVGDTGVVLTVRGSGFTEGSVLWADPWLPMVTTVVDDSTITARIDMLWQAGTHQVVVFNEMYEASDPLTFVVANPAPVITRISPEGCEVDVMVCGPVALHGRNFLQDVQVLWNGSPVSFNRLSDSVVTVQVDAYQLSWQHVVSITAVNPGPGGGSSGAATFQVGPRIVMHTHGATAGSGGFELEIYGESLGSDVVVYWNGSPRQTYRYNAGRVSAYLTAADVTAPGEGIVTLTTYTLGGGQPWRVGTITVRPQPSATVTSQLTMSVPVHDLVYSPFTDRLYGSVYAGSMASHLAVIDPASGVVENLIWVGDDPRYLGVSDDGKYLWVGVDGEFSVKRVNLEWGGYPDFTIQLDSGVVAEDLAAVPGVPFEVAVSRRNTAASPGHAGVAIYNAYYGTPLPSATAAGAGSNVIEFGRTGAALYGVDNETPANQWRTMRVDDDGVTVTRTGFGWAGTGSDVVYAGGRVYSSAGTTVDTGHNDYAGIFYTLQGAVRPDVQTGRAFFLGNGVIQVGDINTFTQLGTLTVPTADYEPAPQRRRLVRWGADGLAFHDADEVFIVRSPMAGN